MTRVRVQRGARVMQGDILRDVDYVEYAVEKAGVVEVSKIEFPLVVVLTQDCDLEQDYRFRWSHKPKHTQDKWLLSVIVAPVYNAEHVFSGEHLSDIGLRMEVINKKKSPGEALMNNKQPRYHYLEFPSKIPIVPAIVDFKHYFTVNVKSLKLHKRTNFVCRLAELYREDLSQRFANYLSRIGLPGAV